MTEAEDRFQAAYEQLTGVLADVQAEHERLRATSETAEQSLGTFADTVAAAADNLRAALPAAEPAEEA